MKNQNHEEFLEWRKENTNILNEDSKYYQTGLKWMNESVRLNYSYMFEWLGVPVIQYPSDLLLIQEALVLSNANKVIEIGIARGGTTLFLASMLGLMHNNGDQMVIGVDISVSRHTADAITNSKLSGYIKIIEGNSILDSTFRDISKLISKNDRVLVILDSNHTMEHVYQEMKMYSDIVTEGSFLIVMDTAIEYVNPDLIPEERPWGRGNNPDTAIRKFLLENAGLFEIDQNLNGRSFPGAAKGGYLRKLVKKNER